MQNFNERILRNTNRSQALRELADAIVKDWMEAGLYQSCLNCDHWQETKEICIKFNERPPAKIIVTGCEFHIDDIPF